MRQWLFPIGETLWGMRTLVFDKSISSQEEGSLVGFAYR